MFGCEYSVCVCVRDIQAPVVRYTGTGLGVFFGCVRSRASLFVKSWRTFHFKQYLTARALFFVGNESHLDFLWYILH